MCDKSLCPWQAHTVDLLQVFLIMFKFSGDETISLNCGASEILRINGNKVVECGMSRIPSKLIFSCCVILQSRVSLGVCAI